MHKELEKKNIKRYYIRYILYYFANAFLTGGIIQSFMLESGISSGQVSVYTAVVQIVQATAMLLLGPVLEKGKDIVRINAEANYLLMPLCICMLIVCFFPGMPAGLKYVILLSASVLAYISYAVIGIIEYKLPYLIINMDNYGVVVLTAGVFIGVSSMLATSLFSFFIGRYDYFKTAAVFLLISIILFETSTIVGRKYTVINPYDDIETGKESSRRGESIFSYGPFKRLFIPNLLRGFASGTFALCTTIGYYYGIIELKTASLMAVITNIVIMVGCIIYSRISKKKIDGPLTLISAVVLCILMPVMLIGKNTVVFILFYAAAVFFKNIIDYSCPVICASIVDYEHAGEFSSWRIALYMLGAALAGFAVIPMLELFGGILTMLINGVTFVIMGINYYSVSRESLEVTKK